MYVPSPSWPVSFSPQAHKFPAESIANDLVATGPHGLPCSRPDLLGPAPGSRGAVPELALSVVAPHPKVTALVDRERMNAPGAHRAPPRAAGIDSGRLRHGVTPGSGASWLKTEHLGDLPLGCLALVADRFYGRR
jgi:hypothetical protein